MRVPLIVPAIAAAAAGVLSTRDAVRDSDVFWHLATARETLAGGIVRSDRFTWTVPGSPLPPDQWLGQVALYLSYLAGDWRGIVALRSLAAALLAALIVHTAISARPTRPLVGVLVALPALLLTRFITTERPELFGFVCFAALIALVYRARDDSDAALFATVPLLALWANLHGSFAVGAFVLAAVAAEGAVRDAVRRRRYVAAAAAGLFATLLTPSGVGAWTAPGSHFLRPPREIQEWAVPDVTTLAGAAFAVVLCGTLATALLSRRARARDAVLLLPLAFLGMTAVRQMPLFAIAATPFLAEHVTAALAALRVRFPSLPPAAAVTRVVDAAAVSLASFAFIVGAITAPAVPDQSAFPVGALEHLPPGAGLLNQYDWGGWLIWYRHETPTFVDGRLVVHAPDAMADYRAVIGVAPGWRDVIARRGIRTLLVRPADPVAVRARDLGWRVIAAGEDFVLIAVP